MNKLLDSLRSVIPENPLLAALGGSEGDMDIDSIRGMKAPPLRKNPYEYDRGEVKNFLELCAGNVKPDSVEIAEIFRWCVKNNEKNALVWWLEKGQEKNLFISRPPPGSVPMLAYVLCRNSSIQNICFHNAACTTESAKELSDALKGNRNLRIISLWTIKFAPNALGYLAEGLNCQFGLKHLHICDTALNDQHPASLIQAVENCDGVELTLGSNQLNFDGVREIFGAIKQGTKIQRLNLFNEKIDEASMREIASCLKAGSGLKAIQFAQSQCVPGTATLLEDALIESSLEEMHITNNSFGSAPGVNIEKIIRESRSLSVLHLDGKAFNAIDIEKISSELIGNCRLQRFTLTNGNFDEEGARSLTVALRENENLCELNLEGCKFAGNAGKDLSDSIGKNTVLEKMNLEKSNLSDEHKTKINKLCERNHEAKRFLQQDALLYSRMAHPAALPAELGALLAKQVLMLSDSAAAFESATIEIALSIRALAANTQNGPQQADAHSGKALQELPPGCTLV